MTGTATERTPIAPKGVRYAAGENSTFSRYSYAAIDGEDEGREVHVWRPGHSSFGQTLLNTLGDLIGTALLACPLAIAYSGWVLGPILLLTVGAVTLWTLKIILRIIAKDRRLRNFTDVIGYALGPRGESIVSVLFVIEVCAWIIALVVLFADSMEAVWPIHTSNEWKLIGLVVIVPTCFMPLSWLSFSSAFGLFSTFVLIAILIFTGLVTPHSPGSIREPAPTDLWPAHGLVKLGTVFGLMMAGFGGHGLIPNLIYDMKNPRQADRMVEIAYLIAMLVYIIVSVFGYLMYGRYVSDEVSRDLAATPGFSPLLAKIAVWTVALTPLTKIALGIRPLADMLFNYWGLHKTELIPETMPTPRYATVPPSPMSEPLSPDGEVRADEIAAEAAANSYFDPTLAATSAFSANAGASAIAIEAEERHERSENRKKWARQAVRFVLAVSSVLGALVMPSFESVVSLLGSLFAVVILIIFPVWAGAAVFGWKWYDRVVIVLAVIIGTIGTVTTFLA